MPPWKDLGRLNVKGDETAGSGNMKGDETVKQNKHQKSE